MIDITDPPTLSVTIDAIPPAKKNGQRILRVGRRQIVKSSKAAVGFEAHLRAVALHLRSLGVNYVGVRITVDERAKRTRIDVWDLGPPPKRGPKDTRRDVHNCADTVMDALQGLAFDDDRQARWVLCQHGEVG